MLSVSVIMATYNGEKHLPEQIESIISCLDPGDELIVSDDGSTDNTLSLVQSFVKKYPNIILVVNDRGVPGNKIAANFNNALSYARNDIIVLCDQDDVWLPNRLSAVRSLHEKYDCVVVDAFIKELGNNSLIKVSDVWRPSVSFFRNFYKLSVLGFQMSFSRKSILQFGKIPQRPYITHDWWWYLNATLLFSTFILDEPLIYYRRHEANYSAGLSKSKNKLATKIIRRFFVALYLFRNAVRVILLKIRHNTHFN